MKTAIVIPSRYASTRLPGKPLCMIAGKPLIRHVWEIATKVKGVDEVVVATDSDEIRKAVTDFGGKAILTSPGCRSGTDRIREILDRLDADLIINLQGDEPLLNPEDLAALVRFMAEYPEAAAGTLYAPITAEEAEENSVVKLVLSHTGKVLYFSRLPLACKPGTYLGHIGVYAYRRPVLENFSALPQSDLEDTERLEQLRLLQADIPIYAIEASGKTIGVDTPSDLARVREVLEADDTSPWQNLKFILTDIDGVWTDGKLCYGADGEVLKMFNAKDGQAIKMAADAGLTIGIISGRDSAPLRTRISHLGIQHFELGVLDKGAACRRLFAKTGFKPEEAVFLGDDLPDVDAFAECAFGVAVKDAMPCAKEKARWITSRKGGDGAFRELVEEVIKRKACRSKS